MTILRFSVGLPGSGKTFLVKQLEAQGFRKFDDFKSNAHDDSPLFHKAQTFQALIGTLKRGQKCVVADIDFCRQEAREEAEHLLPKVAHVSIEWVFFEKNVEQCEANIRHRNSLQPALRLLHPAALS